MNRRHFLGRLSALSTSIAATGAMVGCGGYRYVVGTDGSDRVTLERRSFAGHPDTLVVSSRLARPIYLRELPGEGYSAVLLDCTHRGCEPEPGRDRLVCPCHGSEFAFDGEVLEGPANAPLTRFRVTEADGRITVWLEGGAV